METREIDRVDAFELLAIASSLNSTLDLDFLLQKIGLAAEKILDSEASSIMLLDDSKKFLYFRVAGGEKGGALKKLTLDVGKGIAGWVAAEKKPLVVNDVQSEPRFAKSFDKSSGFQTRSILCVPMICRGELVGVAEVLNKREGGFEVRDVALFSSLANLASVAVLNAKVVQDQKNFFSHALEIFTLAIEVTKPSMESHPSIAARLACAIGRLLEVGGEDYHSLYYAGILHDIGYIGLKNSRILKAMGIIAPTEEHHPVISVKMLEGIHMVHGAIPIIRHHHERYDGAGFPSRLKGAAIPLGARILALVEGVEEVRMVAGLKGTDLISRALKDVKDGKESRYDPEVVSAFEELMEMQPEVWEACLLES